VITEMVRAYGLIGREIVEEEQQWRARAGNGEALLAQHYAELQTRFAKGYTRPTFSTRGSSTSRSRGAWA
jgi:hypothetical protein